MTQDIHLTQLANSGGWASKYSQKDLAQVLRQISNEFDENLIVDNPTSILPDILKGGRKSKKKRKSRNKRKSKKISNYL